MIHEAEDSVSISAGRTAFIWEVRHERTEYKQVEEKIIRQWNLINYYSRKVNIVNADLIL